MALIKSLLVVGVLGLLASSAARAETIVEIEISGDLRKVSESLIRSTLGLETGRTLSQENVQEAVRNLQGLRVFDDIQIYGEPAPGGVKVIVVVRELPTLQGTRFMGNDKLDERTLQQELSLVRGQVIAPWDVSRSQQILTDLYRQKGYLQAQVEGQLFDGEEEGTVYVQFDIDEGQKVRVKAIDVRLRHADGTVSDERYPPFNPRRSGSAVQRSTSGLSVYDIVQQMETKESRWWRSSEFQREVYDEDLERILQVYRYHGFQQAELRSDSVYYDGTRRNLFIELDIDEGPRFYLGDISFLGNELFTSDDLADALGVESKGLYRFSGQQLADMVRLAYFEKGYLDTRVDAAESFRDNTVDVAFTIFEGHPWTVRRVNIAGNTRTREKVIRREIELRPGDVYRQNLLQESQRRIFMLNFFKDVQVIPEYSPSEQDRYVDLTFQVEERPTGQASMGAGYSDRDKLVGQIGLQIPNFRGRGQNVNFSWEFGTRREQFLIGFTEPWLLDTPTSLSAQLYTLQQQYFEFYDYRRDAVTVRIGRRLTKPAYSRLSIGYRLERSKYSDFSEEYEELQHDPRYQPRQTSTFDLTYQRDSRDKSDFPGRGTFFSYKPQLATSAVGGDVSFHRHEVKLNYYRPSWWKFVWSLETKLGVIKGFTDQDSENIPFWERFTPGGVDWWDGQVRGYPDQSLGPRRPPLTGPPIGGNSMLIINLEYRVPLAEQQVYGLLFADAGNAWTGVFDVDPFDLRKSIGFGFRVVTPMLGTLGFDFGYGFNRPKVDGARAGWETHFQLGPQFF